MRRRPPRPKLCPYTTLFRSYNNHQAGILVRLQREVDGVISKNAIASRPGTPTLPAMRNGLKMFGNQDCSANNCFTNPKQLDFTPHADSPPIAAMENQRSRDLQRDYFGSRRPPHAAIGAIEPPGAIVGLGIKP